MRHFPFVGTMLVTALVAARQKAMASGNPGARAHSLPEIRRDSRRECRPSTLRGPSRPVTQCWTLSVHASAVASQDTRCSRAYR
jgi:hypothetical protein